MLFTLIQTLINRNYYSDYQLKMLFAQVLLSIPIILLALSVHETSHGYVANKLGDPTAKSLGRLTLNPFKHFDILGFLMMMLVGYGWAKPVPINTRYFKKPKRDMAICAAAGPISNILMALVFAALYKIFLLIFGTMTITSEVTSNILTLTSLFFYCGIQINVMLAVFNLIPVPPFDGSRIVLAALPTDLYFKIQRYERYILIAFFVLLLTNVLDPVIYFVEDGIIDFIFFIFGIR